MSFLDNLGEYLRQLEHSPRAQSAEPQSASIEPAQIRTLFIRTVERLDERLRIPAGVEVAPLTLRRQYLGPPGTREELFQDWQENDAIVRFAQRLAHLLRQSFGRRASQHELDQWIEIALARRLRLEDALPSPIRTLELDRLSDLAFNELGQDTHSEPALKVEGYAAAIRATRRVEGRLSITPIGRVFLDLTGRDAIRWLLHIEAEQSTGSGDAWRMSREAAQALVQNPAQALRWEDDFPSPPPQLSWPTLRRLAALGIVAIEEVTADYRVQLTTLPLGLALLPEVGKDVASPMSILAGSLLADLTLASAEAFVRPTEKDASGARTSAAAEATARQARMVAHEIRNTLVPVKTALGALYREIQLEPPNEVLGRRRERIDRGIDAMFRFIDQLVEISKLAATPPESFELLAAIRDALASSQQEASHPIESLLPGTLPPVSGHRARVVMALSNVLRNAVQAVPAGSPVIRIRAETADGARAVLVIVEDNGPGVPENMRRAIFDEGVSLRPGGSGLGLALVREVFEKEMRGLVACDASPLGGARFTIRIPVTGVERP
jgi:signal transduction histidine kinase